MEIQSQYHQFASEQFNHLKTFESSELLKTYCTMKGTIDQFFPRQLKIKDIEIFTNSQILSARVILVLEYLFQKQEFRNKNPDIIVLSQQKFKDQKKIINREKFCLKSVKNLKYSYENMYFYITGNLLNTKTEKWQQIRMFLEKIGGLIIHAQNIVYKNVLQKKLNDMNHRYQYVCDIGRIKQKFQNYFFYINKLKIRSNRMNLSDLHKEKQNNHFLESTHDYIQWMFPNHYASRFNSDSYALSYVEAELFYLSQQIGLAMLQSISMFFDFMGIKMSRIDGCLTLLSRKRLVDVLIHNTHNHLRIMRVLACLSITGFRVIALNLIEFLRYAVNQDVQLKSQKYVFERDWQVYDDNHLDYAKILCNTGCDQFKPNHCSMKTYFQKPIVFFFNNENKVQFDINCQKFQRKKFIQKQKEKSIIKIQQNEKKKLKVISKTNQKLMLSKEKNQNLKHKKNFKQTKQNPESKIQIQNF